MMHRPRSGATPHHSQSATNPRALTSARYSAPNRLRANRRCSSVKFLLRENIDQMIRAANSSTKAVESCWYSDIFAHSTWSAKSRINASDSPVMRVLAWLAPLLLAREAHAASAVWLTWLTWEAPPGCRRAVRRRDARPPPPARTPGGRRSARVRRGPPRRRRVGAAPGSDGAMPFGLADLAGFRRNFWRDPRQSPEFR